jgi:hypothetical protein
MKMEQSVPKRRHIKFRRQGITQKKTYNSYYSYSKLQAGTKESYLLGEHTRKSDDQTRYHSDTSSYCCIPRVIVTSCAVGIGCMFCNIDRATFSRSNSYTFASQPWAFWKSSPTIESCASVQLQIWWPGRTCIFYCRVSISNFCWCWM